MPDHEQLYTIPKKDSTARSTLEVEAGWVEFS